MACNYGGTLSPLTSGPTAAAPLNNSVVALRALAALPHTHAAVISGRSLRDLAAVSRLPGAVHLVGSHGAEFDIGYVHGLSESCRADARTCVRAIAEKFGVYYTDNHSVIELTTVEPSKGRALEHLRSQLGVDAAMFAGDAPNDESALATLRGPNLEIRVGEGESVAAHRISSPEALAHLLALLFEMRRAWLFGEDAVDIERHSMLADGSSTALIAPDAKVCWMTHPLPDSGSLFAHILGGDPAGHFSVAPLKDSRLLGQRYVDNTNIVETRWAKMMVSDYLEPSPDGITQLVRVLSGSGTAKITFAPRPDYANAHFNMEIHGSAVHVVGTSDPIILYAAGVDFSLSPDGRRATAVAEVDLRNGPVVLTLRCGDTELFTPDDAGEPSRRAAVAAVSRRWVTSLELPTVKALVDLGSTPEAEGFLRWLDGILAQTPGPEWLHPLYSVTGTPLATEATVESLPGYAGSRPVRIGNAADHQVQLDVFGPVADLIDSLSARNGKYWRKPSAPRCCGKAGMNPPAPTLWPTTARTSTPPSCTSDSPACWRRRIRASRPRSPPSSGNCAWAPRSSATGTTTACRAWRAGSISAPPG